jgi:hypothetical protein
LPCPFPTPSTQTTAVARPRFPASEYTFSGGDAKTGSAKKRGAHAKETTMPAKYTLATVQAIKQDLDALPDIDREYREVSLQKTIQALAPSLRKLRARGYTTERMIEILKERGIHISDTTLSQYLRSRRRGSGEGTPRPSAAAQAALTDLDAAAPKPQPASSRGDGGRKQH